MGFKIKFKDETKKRLSFYFLNNVGKSIWIFGFLSILALTLQERIISNYALLLGLLLFGSILFWNKNVYLKIISMFFTILIIIKPLFFYISKYLFPLIEGYFEFNALSKYIFHDITLIFIFLVGLFLFLDTFKIEIEDKKKNIEERAKLNFRLTTSFFHIAFLFYFVLGVGYAVYMYPIKPLEKLIQSLVFFGGYLLSIKNFNNEKRDLKGKISFDIKLEIFLFTFLIFSVLAHELWKSLLFDNFQSFVSLFANFNFLNIPKTLPYIFSLFFIIIIFSLFSRFFYLINTKLISFYSKEEISSEKPNWEKIKENSKIVYNESLNIFDLMIIFLFIFFLISPIFPILTKGIFLIVTIVLVSLYYFVDTKILRKFDKEDYYKEEKKYSLSERIILISRISLKNISTKFYVRLIILFLLGFISFYGRILTTLS